MKAVAVMGMLFAIFQKDIGWFLLCAAMYASVEDYS